MANSPEHRQMSGDAYWQKVTHFLDLDLEDQPKTLGSTTVENDLGENDQQRSETKSTSPESILESKHNDSLTQKYLRLLEASAMEKIIHHLCQNSSRVCSFSPLQKQI